MEIPHPLICAYHNEILFCNSFGFAKGIFFYLCTCKYLIGLLFWFYFFYLTLMSRLPGRVAQSLTCLATDGCLTADPGVASSIPTRYHTFLEIDHEIISTVILLPSADLFKNGCCQLQAKVCAQITG